MSNNLAITETVREATGLVLPLLITEGSDHQTILDGAFTVIADESLLWITSRFGDRPSYDIERNGIDVREVKEQVEFIHASARYPHPNVPYIMLNIGHAFFSERSKMPLAYSYPLSYSYKGIHDVEQGDLHGLMTVVQSLNLTQVYALLGDEGVSILDSFRSFDLKCVHDYPGQNSSFEICKNGLPVTSSLNESLASRFILEKMNELRASFSNP